MYKSLQPHSVVKYRNVAEHVTNREKLNSFTFRVKPEGNFYLVDGEEVPQAQMEELIPYPPLAYGS